MPCNNCLSSPAVDCKSYPDAHCVNWSGGNLPGIGATTNERLDSILWKINEKLLNLSVPQTFVQGKDEIIVTGNGAQFTPYVVSIASLPWSKITGAPTFLSSFTETDPLFTASAAFNISNQDIFDWTEAFSWGDHSLAGYLTSFTEVDPTVPQWVKDIPAGSNPNHFLHWNGTTYVPGPISYSQIVGTPVIPSPYTDEMAQDAVGRILTDSSSIDFTYNDAGNLITASVIGYKPVNWDLAYDKRIISAQFSGSTTKTLTLTRGDGTQITAQFLDTSQVYTAGDGLSLTGNQFSHANTSSVSSINLAANQRLSNITFDTFGHITGYSVAPAEEPTLYQFRHSIVQSSGVVPFVNLRGDLAEPGPNKAYSTNSSGVRGWYTISSGGGNFQIKEIKFTVGDEDYPQDGDLDYTPLDDLGNPALAGKKIDLIRDGDFEFSADTVKGFTFDDVTGTIYFYPELYKEDIRIRIYESDNIVPFVPQPLADGLLVEPGIYLSIDGLSKLLI